MSRWTGGPRPKEGGELAAKSGEAQSKGGGYGGSWNMEGDGDDPKQLKWWDIDRYKSH